MRKIKTTGHYQISIDDYKGRNLRHILASSSKENKYLYLENRLSKQGLFSVFLIEHKNKILLESKDFETAINKFNEIT